MQPRKWVRRFGAGYNATFLSLMKLNERTNEEVRINPLSVEYANSVLAKNLLMFKKDRIRSGPHQAISGL